MTTTIDQKLILYAQLCISWMRNNFQHIMELYNTDTYPQASSPHLTTAIVKADALFRK